MEEGDWGIPAALGEGEGSKRGLPGARWVPPATTLPQNWPTWKKRPAGEAFGGQDVQPFTEEGPC